MIDVLLVVLAILLCLISVMKAREYRQTGLSTHGWMAFVFALLAVAFLLRISGVYLWVERAFGPKSLADAVVRTALMAAAFGAQSLIREVSIPNSMRSAWRGSRPTALLVCLSALWSSFIIGHRSGDSQFGSFANVAGWPTVYAAAFLLYMAYVATDVMLGCWRYAKPADGSLQLGLRFMAIGCGTTVIYVGFKATAVVRAHSSPISTAVEAGVGETAAVLAALPIAVGAALPAAERRWRAALDWRRRYAAHDKLYPLWSALTAVSPGVALDPATSRTLDRLRIRDLEMRLYRRVIEIRDGRLALRDALPQSVAESSQARAQVIGLNRWEAEAFVEAKVLEAGLESIAAGDPVAAQPWKGIGPRAESTAVEVEWLRTVAANFAAPRSLHARNEGVSSGRARGLLWSKS